MSQRATAKARHDVGGESRLQVCRGDRPRRREKYYMYLYRLLLRVARNTVTANSRPVTHSVQKSTARAQSSFFGRNLWLRKSGFFSTRYANIHTHGRRSAGPCSGSGHHQTYAPLNFIFVCPYHQALGKLSAQAEEVGAANLGDLDGFAKEMTAEVDTLRQVGILLQ